MRISGRSRLMCDADWFKSHRTAFIFAVYICKINLRNVIRIWFWFEDPAGTAEQWEHVSFIKTSQPWPQYLSLYVFSHVSLHDWKVIFLDFQFLFQNVPIDICVLSESGCTCWCPACIWGSCFCKELQIFTAEHQYIYNTRDSDFL